MNELFKVTVTTLILPFIAAFFGSLIAMLKFKKERLWQEKYKAYQEILNSAETIKLWATEMARSSYLMPTINFFDGKKPYEAYSEARRQVSKYICVGKLLISEDVRERLEKMENEIYSEEFRANEDDFTDDPSEKERLFGQHARKIERIIDKYLPDIIKNAKSDLF